MSPQDKDRYLIELLADALESENNSYRRTCKICDKPTAGRKTLCGPHYSEVKKEQNKPRNQRKAS